MRAIDAEKAIEIIEAKQKELCPVGRYGRNYVYGTDRERYDAWEEIIDALENIPTLTPPNEVLTCDGCYYLDRDPAPCAYCIRSKPEGDHYRCPPEGEV